MENINILYEYSFSLDKNRGKIWYFMVLSFLIWIVIWGVLTKQYWLSFVVILFSWVYLLVENNIDTDKVIVKITDLWIFINDSFYEYENIPYFSIIYDGSNAIFLRLYLKTWIKIINLDIDNEKVTNIKNILKNYVEEREWDKLNLFDKIIRFFKL
jgi:hypothetical protein